jgi:Flp pilus assembly protein TadG
MRKNEHGQGLVEFLLVLPILLIVLVGVFDLGRVFFITITIQNATREGARYGISQYGVPGKSITQVFSETINYTVAESANSGIALAPGNVQVTCPSGCARQQSLRVTVSFPFRPVIGLILPAQLMINRFAEMRIP